MARKAKDFRLKERQSGKIWQMESKARERKGKQEKSD
jgi:hypothetical protein